MTWFGKTLAVLCIPATLAFVALAFMDYAKREAWAYANFVHDVAVEGLPLDDKTADDHETPLVYKLANETKQEWFGGNGGPVDTQVQEVKRIQGLTDGKVNAVSDDAQTVEYARILKPFAAHNSEREWLIAVAAYLSDAAGSDRLNKRLHDAFPAAVMAYQARPDDLKFPEAFEAACAALGGAPARPFEQTFVSLLPAKPENSFEDAVKDAQKVAVPKEATPEQEAHLRAEAFLSNLRGDKATVRKPTDDPAKVKDTMDDDLFAQTKTAVHDQLKKQYDGLYDEALNGPPSLAAPATRVRDAQRQAVAHLLFNMVEALDETAPDKGVIGNAAYGRVIAVVGLKAAANEISDQAWRLQRIGQELQGARRMERGTFADAHRALIDELQGQAVTLHDTMYLLDRKKQQLADEEGVVARRRDDVKQAEDKLAEARSITEKQITELRKKSDALHERRIQSRDVLGENLELERQIRELEKKR